MSRYRPPSKPSSPYITPEGRSRLETELRYLSDTLRPEVTKALSAAAAEGDRSENAEFVVEPRWAYQMVLMHLNTITYK